MYYIILCACVLCAERGNNNNNTVLRLFLPDRVKADATVSDIDAAIKIHSVKRAVRRDAFCKKKKKTPSLRSCTLLCVRTCDWRESQYWVSICNVVLSLCPLCGRMRVCGAHIGIPMKKKKKTVGYHNNKLNRNFRASF